MGLHRKEKREIKARQRAGVGPANEKRKRRERARRDAWMMARVKGGKPPFTPAVMSWLSTKLGKPSKNISAEDVAALLKTSARSA
jgi:hypothetical protein